MSTNQAEADPLTLTSEETFSLAALPTGEAPASVPATPTQDAPISDAATQPVLDVEALDEAGYYQQIANLDAALANPPKEADATQSQTEEATEEAPVDPETEVNPDIPLEEANLPERVRIGNWTEIERKAILLRQRNPDMSLAEALSRVSPQQEISPDVEPQQAMPSIQEIEAKIEALESEEEAAFTNVELDKIPALRRQIKALEKEAKAAEILQIKQQEQESTRFENTVSTSKSRAVELYPDVTKAESPLVQKMIEIDNRLKESDNPLYFSAEKPLKVAQMAANELGIPPRDLRQKPSPSKATTSPQRTPAAPANGRPTTPPIAPANARTSRPSPAVVNGSFDDLLSKATSMDDLIAIASKLGR
jgi:hypothetical protein